MVENEGCDETDFGYSLVVESQDDIAIYYKGKRILTLAVPDKEVTFHY